MKRYARLTAILSLAVLTVAAAATAQGFDTVTNVPFQFSVGDTSLPRGTYRVSRLPGNLVAFQIRSEHGGAIVMNQPAGVDEKDASPRLVFHRYGNAYFLREVRMAGNFGYELPSGQAERDAAERLASRARPDVVVVPADAR